MSNVRAINPIEYNLKLAEALKEISELKQPAWLDFVKTSSHKSRPTLEPDFYYKRVASILRQAYLKGTVGVSRLRSRYGGRKNRGMEPAKFVKSGGKIIRTILQQSEAAGLLEKSKGKKAGRQLTSQGKQLLESIK
jgi:small subunit ribosomal protein S19e